MRFQNCPLYHCRLKVTTLKEIGIEYWNSNLLIQIEFSRKCIIYGYIELIS